jgi:hypothetical protein
MAEPQSATPKVRARTKRLSIGEQENLILAVYADMIENDDLMRHAGIAPRPDPTTAILRHYWLGFDRGYDVSRAIEDFVSWPPIFARCDELRSRRSNRTVRSTRQ